MRADERHDDIEQTDIGPVLLRDGDGCGPKLRPLVVVLRVGQRVRFVLCQEVQLRNLRNGGGRAVKLGAEQQSLRRRHPDSCYRAERRAVDMGLHP